MSKLYIAHQRLAGILGDGAEPLEVLQQVEDHRAYWRPEKPKVILLAESHVYTATSELVRSLRSLPDLPASTPKGFVRLVYCIGYGENELLDEPLPKNTGTPQFWKIFKSCLTPLGQDPDFASLQRGPDITAAMRLQSKLAVLCELKSRGIWLVDASVAALYRPGRDPLTPKRKVAALRASWDLWTREVVETAVPQSVLCIGVGVVRCLRDQLDRLNIPWAGVHQPQSHLSREAHAKIHATYSAICADPTRIRLVTAI